MAWILQDKQQKLDIENIGTDYLHGKKKQKTLKTCVNE